MSNPKPSSTMVIVEMVIYAIIQTLYLINYLPVGFK